MARVLIVEDEQTDRVFLGNVIEGGGHQVYFASDGEQAFKTYMRRSIDVVVTDLLMPNVDGMEFIVALKTLFASAPVIAVSGQGPELLAAAETKGACVTLTKPVDPHEILAAIARVAPDNARPAMPKSKLAFRGDDHLLDEFEFEYQGQVRCIPAGGKLVDWLARTAEPLWDIRLDGTSIGQVEANREETMETVRKAASRLVDELPAGWAREKSAYGALADAVLQQKTVTPEVTVPPEVVVTPEVAVTPEVEVKPEVVVTPEVAVKPDVAVTPEVEVEPDVAVAPEVVEQIAQPDPALLVDNSNGDEPLLKAAEVGEMLGISTNSVYQLPIERVRLGKRTVRWRPELVREFLEGRDESP